MIKNTENTYHNYPDLSKCRGNGSLSIASSRRTSGALCVLVLALLPSQRGEAQDSSFALANLSLITPFGVTDGGYESATTSFTDVVFTDDGNWFAYGKSTFSNQTASWVSSSSTVRNDRLGQWQDAIYTGTGPRQSTTIGGTSGDKIIYGESYQYNGTTISGRYAWTYNVATGASARIGLTGGIYDLSGGYQYSEILAASSQYIGGFSRRNTGTTNYTRDAWLYDTASDTTSKVGLTGTGQSLYGNTEFEKTGNSTQYHTISNITESGYVSGQSRRYWGTEDSALNQAAWVYKAQSDTTLRLGFYDDISTWSEEELKAGSEYTQANNLPVLAGSQLSAVTVVTEQGYALGYSQRYTADGSFNSFNRTSWITNIADATTETDLTYTKLGLTGDSYIGANDIRYSEVSVTTPAQNTFTQTGYLFGITHRYNEIGTQIGQAAWIANESTGFEAIHVPGFTEDTALSKFNANNGAQSSAVLSINSAGYISGSSSIYNGSNASGSALWITTTSNPSDDVQRIGLYEETEFSTSNQIQSSSVSITLTESGRIAGTSNRYKTGTASPNGTAAWVASIKGDGTVQTHRIGLEKDSDGNDVAEFTNDNKYQNSTIFTSGNASLLLEQKGRVLGTTVRYKGTAATTVQGYGAWIADADGNTRRLGLTGEAFTMQAGDNAGKQLTTIVGTDGDNYVWGFSQRYTATAKVDVATNRTAWIYSLVSEQQFDFQLSESTDGISFSFINGITESGFAYGYYTLYDGSENKGDRAFLWKEGHDDIYDINSIIGTELAAAGANYLSSIQAVNEDGGILTLIGQAVLTNGTSALFSAQFVVAPIPEPAAWALLVAALCLTSVIFKKIHRNISK
ncbi:hypothetical protein [Geminisphaera colitermitum]|uniref:hypothetical protein n=1 Tax=Geminisphaera colitermitum TaxID=1148786 RepID=UPI000158CF18|nr:hypothetical protein [Geminisphaera colitermitum]